MYGIFERIKRHGKIAAFHNDWFSDIRDSTYKELGIDNSASASENLSAVAANVSQIAANVTTPSTTPSAPTVTAGPIARPTLSLPGGTIGLLAILGIGAFFLFRSKR